MTNLCTKVTVRQRKLAKGKVSLYLDYYPAIRHPRTGRMTTPRSGSSRSTTAR